MVLFGTVVRRRRSRLPQLTSRLDHTGSQKQREGLRKGDCSELYFVTKHNHIGKCTMGSLAGAGSEARAGSGRPRPAIGRRGRPRPVGSLNRTEHRSSGSIRPSASVHYGRTDTFRQLRIEREHQRPLVPVTVVLASHVVCWRIVSSAYKKNNVAHRQMTRVAAQMVM